MQSYSKFERDLQNTQTQTQNPNTQKIEKPHPNSNFWACLDAHVCPPPPHFSGITFPFKDDSATNTGRQKSLACPRRHPIGRLLESPAPFHDGHSRHDQPSSFPDHRWLRRGQELPGGVRFSHRLLQYRLSYAHHEHFARRHEGPSSSRHASRSHV